MLYCTHVLTKGEQKKNGGRVEFVSSFLRMVLVIYVIYKENIYARCKPVFRLDHTIKIVDAVGEECLQENSAAGLSGTKNETYSYHLREVPTKKEKDFCVWSTRTKHRPVKRWRSRTVCIECEKGLHRECFHQGCVLCRALVY
jgi:hypothetical protein